VYPLRLNSPLCRKHFFWQGGLLVFLLMQVVAEFQGEARSFTDGFQACLGKE
jgi:hypothetical protein